VHKVYEGHAIKWHVRELRTGRQIGGAVTIGVAKGIAQSNLDKAVSRDKNKLEEIIKQKELEIASN
jgi:hypothetical protein